MFLAKKILAALVLPPAGPLLLALAGLWLAGRRPRTGRLIAALALALLLALSVPWVADHLSATIEDVAPPTPAQLAAAQAIVILSGDAYRQAPEYGGDTVGQVTLERLRYGARLARQTGLPVLVSGGAPFGGRPEADLMKETLAQDFQVTVRWTEDRSRDTAENAALSAPLLKQAGIDRILLVTHASHMRRAGDLFAAAGFQAIPAPTGFAGGEASLLESLLPSAKALSQSYRVLHEHLGQLAAHR
ncbi:MAG TPA: YdcF family protein [Rhodocyclaceae bacterium]|nr:YdcF family protein [Rhodocyclaceae bacterium]